MDSLGELGLSFFGVDKETLIFKKRGGREQASERPFRVVREFRSYGCGTLNPKLSTARFRVKELGLRGQDGNWASVVRLKF